MDAITIFRTGLGQSLVDTKLLKTRMCVIKCFEVREIGKSDGSFGLAPDNPVAAVVFALDADSFGDGAMHDEPFDLGLDATSFANRVSHEASEARKTRADNGGNAHIEFEAIFSDSGFPRLSKSGVMRGEISTGTDDQPGTLKKFRLIRTELVEEDPRLFSGRISGRSVSASAEVDKKNERPGPFNVAEESMPETSTFTCALDQTRNIGDDVLESIVESNDTKVGFESREGIVGDLGLCRRNARDERGLTYVGIPDERNVGHELDFEIEPAFLTNLALLGERRGPAGVREETGIALATLPTSGRHPAIPLGHKISEDSAIAVKNDGSFRYMDKEVISTGTVLLLARSVGATTGPAMGMVAKGQK